MSYPINPRFDTLDALIKLTCPTCMDKEVDEYLCTPIDHPLDLKTKRKIHRQIQKLTKAPQYPPMRRSLRLIGVTAILILSLAFVACMSVPKVRQAIWEAVVELYEDHVSIDFADPYSEPGADRNPPASAVTSVAGSADSDKSAIAPQQDPPKTIVETNAPTYVPEGYEMSECATDKLYIADYFSSSTNTMYSFTQSIIQESHYDGNSEECNLSEIQFNGLTALLITYTASNEYSLYWQDSQYQYRLFGQFESYDQLIQIATSVSIK